MALRTVVYRGVEWTVWDVVRSLQEHTSLPLPEGASASWLCFTGGTERRRLVPAPPGWERWSDEVLVLALQSARVVGVADAAPPGGPSGPSGAPLLPEHT